MYSVRKGPGRPRRYTAHVLAETPTFTHLVTYDECGPSDRNSRGVAVHPLPLTPRLLFSLTIANSPRPEHISLPSVRLTGDRHPTHMSLGVGSTTHLFPFFYCHLLAQEMAMSVQMATLCHSFSVVRDYKLIAVDIRLSLIHIDAVGTISRSDLVTWVDEQSK